MAKIKAIPDRNEAVHTVHGLLAQAQVRYCSPRSDTSIKAEAIVENAYAPLFDGGADDFLAALRQRVGEPGEQGLFSHEQARDVRKHLIRELFFFGPKGASDFLIGLGLAESFLALDVRLLNLFVDCLGWSQAIRRQVHSLVRYEAVERAAIEQLAKPLGWSGADLDRVLFYHYAYLKQIWGPSENAMESGKGKGGAAAENTVC